MVNTGVPSTACQRCRKKRLRCDRKPDACGNCTRAGQVCSGYRSALELKFHDQTAAAAAMVCTRIAMHQAKEAGKRKTPRGQSMADCALAGIGSISIARPTYGEFSSAHIQQSSWQIRDVVHWWLARHETKSAFDTAHRIWIEPYWPMAMDSPAFFHCVSFLSMVIKQRLTHAAQSDVCLEQKGHLLQQVRNDIERNGAKIDHKTILAVCGLAYCEVMDGRVDIALSHIRGIESTQAYALLGQAEWLFVAWTDLRIAVHTRRAPLLRYYIPSSVHDDELQQHRDPRAYGLASYFASLCPDIPALELHFTSVFDIFVKYYELLLALPDIEHTAQPPFRQLYDIEYKLRVLYRRVHTDLERGEEAQLRSTAIVLLALQLQVWVVSCSWTPTRPQALADVLSSAVSLLTATPPIATTWQLQASVFSLTWALVTLVSCTNDLVSQHSLRATLADAFDKANFSDIGPFLEAAARWPFPPGKRAQWLERAWSAVQLHRTSLLPLSHDEHANCREVDTSNRQAESVLLGPLEFLDL